MEEVKETNRSKVDFSQTELGKAVEANETKDTSRNKFDAAQTELGKTVEATETKETNLPEAVEELTDEELNEPIEEVVMPDMKSADCRSECKYNTGDKTKYSNYGYSD